MGAFAGRFVFPITPLLQRPVKGNSPRSTAIIDTTTTVPAFLRMKYDRWLAFLRMGDVDIYLTMFNTHIAPVANLRVKDDRSVRSWYIGNSIDLFFCHKSLLKYFHISIIFKSQ
jgi:hypothetical protein